MLQSPESRGEVLDRASDLQLRPGGRFSSCHLKPPEIVTQYITLVFGAMGISSYTGEENVCC